MIDHRSLEGIPLIDNPDFDPIQPVNGPAFEQGGLRQSQFSMMTMMKSRWSFLLLVMILACNTVNAYVSKAIQDEWRKPDFTVEKAMNTIAECANAGKENDDLYGAVRFIDRNAHHIYADPTEKDALMERAKGSWEVCL
jgi:hypothetical protein